MPEPEHSEQHGHAEDPGLAQPSEQTEQSEQSAYTLRLADEFTYGLAGIYSERLLGQIRSILETLRHFPDLGSAEIRPSLKERYGEGIRKIPVPTFVIVYRRNGEFIDVLALVYGRAIR